LRQGILSLIDSEIGGIAYAEQFVEALKAALVAHWIPLFRRDADTFGELSAKVISQLYDQAAENLQKESKGGLLRSPSRQRMETIVNQLKDTLTTWMQYRLRQIACAKAADLLESVNTALGEAAGAAADGKPQFTGILRDIHDGLATIEDTIADLDREAKLIRDPDTAHNPIHQVIGSASGAPALVISADAYRNLAAKAFENYGGATKLFEELRDREKRAKVLGRIRRVASEESGPSGKPILPAESEVPSLIDELGKQLRGKQEEIIGRAVSQAMPWVNIAKGSIGTAWAEDMNSVFVCVQDRERFKAAFGGMLSKAVSAHVDVTKEINYVESSSPGRLLICTELSGLPLDALIQLHDDWFRQYENIREDSKQAPLHTHKDWEKFARPTAPDASEMKARLDDVGLFIRGVGFGLLRRRTASRFPNAPDKVGQYEINLSAGLTANNWVPIGRELKIKNFGLKNDHRNALEKDLRTFSEGFSPIQVLAAASLFEYYTQRHYAPRLVGKEELARSGLGHLASDALVGLFVRQLKETPEGLKLGGSDDVLKANVKAFLSRLDDWTVEIEGSLDDVDGMEANKNPDTDIDRRARPKRMLRLDVFENEQTLHQILTGDGSNAKAASAPATEAGQFFWYVGPDGKASSRVADLATIVRLYSEGTITPATKLCARGSTNWRPVQDWPEFADLCGSPPPLDGDGPPPLN
jgi:hypothetical protein